jgi:hypothetical protein
MNKASIVLVFPLVLSAFSVRAQQTCCFRDVATTPIDVGTLYLAFESLIHQDSRASDCHEYDIISIQGVEELRRLDDAIGRLYGAEPDPEAERIYSDLLYLDYLFRGELNAIEGAGGPGHYTLNMRIVDQQRGQVVKEESTSWTGTKEDGEDAVRALARTFLPLDELIYDYERIPETATVQPERDPIEAGETMVVQVRNIVDHEDRPSKPWQRILARADKGKILNGASQGDGFRRFEAGDGSVDLKYRAPDACKRQTETITIYNSCTNDFRKNVNFIPENEIAIRNFEIICTPEDAWTGTITYTRNYNKVITQQGPNNSTVKTHEIVTEKADIEVHGWPYSHSYEETVGTELYYEGDEGSVTGSYSGSYKKITTISSSEGTGTITDTALCQALIRDGGYLMINNEEGSASLEFGVSFVGDRPCHGQTLYSGPRGSHTMEFDWDQYETFAGLGFLECSIAAKNPRTVTGSYSLPEWGITWTWNLSRSGP